MDFSDAIKLSINKIRSRQ